MIDCDVLFWIRASGLRREARQAMGVGPHRKVIVVAAAVIEQDNLFLLTRRQAGTHLEGLWEFPGGKCEAGETPATCLAREILEELGAASSIGAEIWTTTFQYADRTIELHFLECRLLDEPRPLLGQEMQWVPRAGLSELQLPPADHELIRLLQRKQD